MAKIFKNNNDQIRSGWKIAIVFACFFGAVNVLAAPFIIVGFVKYIAQNPGAEFNMEISREIAMGSPWIMVMQSVAMIGTPLLFWKALEKQPVKNMGLTSFKKDWKNFIIGLAFGIVSISAVFGILVASGDLVVKNSTSPQFPTGLMMSLFMFIGVGFSEEILGRGYMMSVLKQTGSKWKMLIISSIIFSFMHAMNPNTGILPFVNLFLFGALVAYMFLATNNIWMPIGYHITWNFFQGNIYGIAVSGLEQEGVYSSYMPTNNIVNGGDFGVEGGVITTFIIAVSFVIIWAIWGRKNKPFQTPLTEETAA
jgi:membrane protease YdiL (CAAX protease family)